ncbi:MAG: hypothetical protein KKF58_01070 [Gammaproteobacteria bacterium]|nr:hypothetical protein [Gammaproteobacteria bacterium]MBU1446878.1 hypothetical protein [Gammaproteobacteria bacterium]
MADHKIYNGVLDIFRRYWNIYGGWRALIASPYVHLSILLCAVSVGFWWNNDWWNQSISVLPNLLGFTLGGFAVFLGFGDEKFKALIAGKPDGESERHSPYLGFSVTYLHFVLVQIVALLWAVLANATHFPTPECLMPIKGFLQIADKVSSGIGYWLFLYSICAAVAAAIGIFRVASMFDKYQTHMNKNAAKDSQAEQ